jgi:hypothetical protein
MTRSDDWLEAELEYAAKVRADAAAFAARWPAYCKACGGWGATSYEERHGFKGGGSETITDPCEAHADPRICHRCGCVGLTDDGEGPCSACGWNYDDGMPA